MARGITDAIVFLKGFPDATLKDVMVLLQGGSIHSINDRLSGQAITGRLEELEQTLLKFPRPRVVCLVDRLRHGRSSFWTQELARCFPLLLQRGAFTLTPTTGGC